MLYDNSWCHILLAIRLYLYVQLRIRIHVLGYPFNTTNDRVLIWRSFDKFMMGGVILKDLFQDSVSEHRTHRWVGDFSGSVACGSSSSSSSSKPTELATRNSGLCPTVPSIPKRPGLGLLPWQLSRHVDFFPDMTINIGALEIIQKKAKRQASIDVGLMTSKRECVLTGRVVERSGPGLLAMPHYWRWPHCTWAL